MDCCAPTASPPEPHRARGGGPATITRRRLLKGAVLSAGAAGLAACGIRSGDDPEGAGDGGESLQSVTLAFCGQLLCVVPYEVTRAQGYFEDEGLDVELVYSRGGTDAVQALNGGSVDYAASSFDAQVGAVASGAEVRRFMTTGRLPLFALATAPDTADEITSIADLRGRKVAISGPGNADETILLYVLDRNGVDPDDVEFTSIGTNLYDALRLGQVDAGMVQEPALSLLTEEGGRELVNFMDIDDAQEVFGGAYEFMGVSIREGEQEERADQLQAMARALRRGLEHTRNGPVEDAIEALPSELTTGEDSDRLAAIIERYRESLWPAEVELDEDAAQRVLTALSEAGAIEREVTLEETLDTSVLA